jgi:hypothetical protein
MARSGGLENPTFWFVAVRPTLPNLARGVASRTESASWGKFPQPTFSFIYRDLRHFCRRLLQFALHFRDSIAIQPNVPGGANPVVPQRGAGLCKLLKLPPEQAPLFAYSQLGHIVQLFFVSSNARAE